MDEAFYLVWDQDGKFPAITVGDKAAALEEAMRLAQMYPVKVYVLKAMAHFARPVEPVLTNLKDMKANIEE